MKKYYCIAFFIIHTPLLLIANIEPFFAVSEPSGSIMVKLFPTEKIPTNTPTIVTFGIPFTKSSLSVDSIKTVRILKNGIEIPAFVELQTPWRNFSNTDNKFVRVAIIQVSYSFFVQFPNYEEITIEWGKNLRTKSINTFQNPRTAWHLVTSGTFAVEDSVYEPDVFVVLPKTHLTKGILNLQRMLPLNDNISEQRDEPSLLKNSFTDKNFLAQEYAQKNNFFTIINEDNILVQDKNQCKYKTDFDVWLYDRASTMFLLYMRSGWLQPLREAVRATEFYRKHLYTKETIPAKAVGIFQLKVPSLDNYYTDGNKAMYSYNECLAYTFWLTGDTVVLSHIQDVVTAHENNDEPSRWNPKSPTFTERHLAFRLLSNIIAYEIFGTDSYKQNIVTQTSDFIWHQNGASGLLPKNKIDGGLYHYGRQNAGDGSANEFIISPWMSAILTNAMVRAFAVTEDNAIAKFIKRTGTALVASLKKDKNNVYGNDLYYCDYIMKYDGTTDERDGTEIEHSLDVLSAIQWANYFTALLNEPIKTSQQIMTQQLYKSYNMGVNYWIRPDAAKNFGLPEFRVAPWRKYNWEHRIAGSISWIAKTLVDYIPTPTVFIPKLYNNYPNPFSVLTTIEFSVPQDMYVELKIYNILGQEIEMIFQGWEKAGKYLVEWDAQKFSSGIYFYRLHAGNFFETKKMVVVR